MIKFVLSLLFLNCMPLQATQVDLQIQGISSPDIILQLRADLSLKSVLADEHKNLSTNRINYLHEQAATEIKQSLQKLGFYQAVLNLSLEQTQMAGSDPTILPSIWQANYQIQLGKPTYIQTLDIQIQGEGKKDSELNKIIDAFSLKVGDQVQQIPFQKLQQQIKSSAEKRGYIKAKTRRFELVISDNKQTAALYFYFDSGKRYDSNVLKQQIELDIQGVKDKQILSNIKTYSSLYQQGQSAKKMLSESRVNYLYKQAKQEIRQALQPFGYYHPQMKTELKPRPATKDAPQGWQARYHIVLGEPTRIKTLDIQLMGAGKNDPMLIALIDKFPLKIGGRLQHAPYERLKNQLKSLAENRGYFEAKASRHEIRINPDSKTVAIHFHFDSGQRYRFGQVTFTQTRFKESVLKRYINFSQGEYYQRKTLLDFRRSLGNSGYFKEINIKKIKYKETGVLDLEVNMTLARADSYRIRIGYGTDSALRLGLDAGWGQLNRYGHSVKLHSKLVTERNRLLGSIEYRIPTGNYKEHYLSTTLSYRSEDFRPVDAGLDAEFAISGAKTRDTNMSLSFDQHRIRHFLGLKVEETVGLSYTKEQYNLLDLMFSSGQINLLQTLAQGGDPDVRQEDLDSLKPSYHVLAPKISWIYTETDNPIYTTHGQQVKLSLMGGREGWGSNVNFWQISLYSAIIRRLHQNGRLILRGALAYTDAKTINIFNTGNTVNRLPKSLQFRTGGDRSVRGYGFESLDGGNETLVSAKHLLTSSVEYEYRFLKDWSWAAFVDVGNAFNDFKQMNLETGVGTGIRWHSPVGLVRLDIAFPVVTGIKDFRFHLNIGPDF